MMIGMAAEMVMNARPGLADRFRIPVQCVEDEILSAVNINAFQAMWNFGVRIGNRSA